MKDLNKLWIVGDFQNKKPFMIVKYSKGKNNNYVGHKVLERFKTEKEAQEYLK